MARPSPWLLLTCLSWTAACGSGVHDLGDEAGPLAFVQGEVTGDVARRLPEGRAVDDLRLRAGLLWAALAEPGTYCQRYGNPLLPGGEVSEVARVACPDLLGVAPGLVGPSAALDTRSSSFEVPLLHLPTAESMVGEVSARVAYASVVLYDDVNGNGTLDLIERPRWRWRDHDDDGGPGDRRLRRARLREWPEEDPATTDAIYAASFVTMGASHRRLAFREGAFATSFFYPMLGCDPPPQGFSVVDVKGPVFQPTCSATPLADAALTLPVAAPSALDDLRCAQPRHQLGVYPEDEPDPSWPRHCVSRDELVTADPDAACPGIAQLVLKGCPGQPDCRYPDWNMCKSPPDWWPCTEADDPPPDEGRGGGGRGGPPR